MIELLKIPYFITSMSKGGISEQIGGKFGGVYGGGASTEAVRTAVEKADLVLSIGTYPVRRGFLFEMGRANDWKLE